MKKAFEMYEEFIRFLEWRKSIEGQVFYVNLVKRSIRYDKPFLKELDEAMGTMYYCPASEGTRYDLIFEY